MRPVNTSVKENGATEPHRSVQLPKNFIKDRPVVPKYCMYYIKIPGQQKENYDIQNITSCRVPK